MKAKYIVAIELGALGLILAALYGGLYLIRLLSVSTNVDMNILFALADFIRLACPVLGGYLLGLKLGEHGIVRGAVVGVLAAIFFEIGNPDWYFNEFWDQILVSSVVKFAVPVALAAGCGELHSQNGRKDERYV